MAERPENNVTAMSPEAREQFEHNEEQNRKQLKANRDRNGRRGDGDGDHGVGRDCDRSRDRDGGHRGGRNRDGSQDRDHDWGDHRRVTLGGFVTQMSTGFDDSRTIRRDDRRSDYRRDYGRGYRHYRYNHHRHGYFYHPMAVINYGPIVLLPDGYDSISYGGVNYYYSEGQFYVSSNGRLVGAYPPMGAVIMRLPENRAEILLRDATYYVYDGVFYQRNGSGFQVVVPPFAQDASNGVLISKSNNEKVTIRLPRENGGYTEVI